MLITGEKRPGLQVDTDHGAQKHPWHTGKLGEGVSLTPISSQTQGILATSPDTVIGHDDDIVAVTSSHGTGGSLACQASPAAVGSSAAAHEDLIQEVNSFHETLGQTQRTLDAVQARLCTIKVI